MNFQQEIIADRVREHNYEQRAAEQEARVDMLLTTDEYNPLLYLNFWEALTEASQRQLNDIAAMLKEKRFDDAGREVLRITTEYWRRAALSEV